MGKILLAMGFALSAATASNAAVIVSAVGATATNEFGPGFEITNTIDQSGLSANYVSGVTDFDAYIGANPIHSFTALDLEWFTEEDVLTATVVYDLGVALRLDRFALWHEEASGFSTALISHSLDGISFTGSPTINPVDSPLTTDYGAQVFGFGGIIMARYVQFDIRDCPDATFTFNACAMGEVAFSSPVPIPGALVFLLSGVGGLAVVRRRTRT